MPLLSSEQKAVGADLIAGTLGGCCGILVGSPFDTIKVRLQTAAAATSTGSIRTTTALDCLLTTVRREGPIALFKGCLSPLIAASPINAALFAVNAYSLRKLNKATLSRDDIANPHQSLTYYRNVFLSGSVGGLSTIFFSAPSELVKCRMQVQIDEIKHQTAAATSNLKTDAASSVPISGAANSAFAAQHPAAHNTVSHAHSHRHRSHTHQSHSYSHVTPTYRSIAQSPLHSQSQLYRTVKMQSHITTFGSNSTVSSHSAIHPAASTSASIAAKSATPLYASTLDCARQIYRIEGFKGLNRGWCATAARDVPSCAVYFCGYEFVKNSIAHRRQQRQIAKQAQSKPNPFALDSHHNEMTHSAVASRSAPPANGPATIDMLLAGGVAGVLSWTSCYSTDVLKSHVQTRPAMGQPFLRMWPTAVQCYNDHGASFFFRGFGTTIIRAIPVNMVTFAVYETLLTVFKERLQFEQSSKQSQAETVAVIEFR